MPDSVAAAMHARTSRLDQSTRSLLQSYIFSVRSCEAMIEAENDRLYRQVNALMDIVDGYVRAERHEHVTELVKASFRREDYPTAGRDLEEFGKLYSLRNRQEVQLAAALDAQAFGWMETTNGDLMERERNAIEYNMAAINSIERSSLGCIICVDDVCTDRVLSYVSGVPKPEVAYASYENAQAFLALSLPAKNYDPSIIEFNDLSEDVDDVDTIAAIERFW